jgi:hypothetical protein
MAGSTRTKRQPARRDKAPIRKDKIDDFRPLLADFLKNNPGSDLETLEPPTNIVVVSAPWGDNSVSLALLRTDNPVVAVLNNVYLPPRLTALWHLDTKLLEIIFTADPLPDIWDDLPKRSFSFVHRETEYKCYFSKSSDRLETIALTAMPRLPSRTGYRNLLSYQRYTYAKSGIGGVTIQQNAFPLSFWIEGIDWDENNVVDPFRRYLYGYQILEYAATYYLEDNVRRLIRRAVAAPDVVNNIDRVTQQIVEAIGESKIADPQKLESLLKQTVNPSIIWNEIARNIGVFSQAITFEGGFIQQPIAKVGWTLEDFVVNWCPAFPNAIRAIRNALSHGRDQRAGTVILPTVENFRALQSWVPLVGAAAKEVMVYRNVA